MENNQSQNEAIKRRIRECEVYISRLKGSGRYLNPTSNAGKEDRELIAAMEDEIKTLRNKLK